MGQRVAKGKRIRTSIVVGAIAAVVAGSWLLGTAESTTAAPVHGSAQFDIPSHNGVYRASMSPSDGGWTVQVRTANGAVADGAAITLEGWMPDDSSVVPVRADVEPRGGGEYRVDGMQLQHAGWWNVRVLIATASRTDSLAFNFVR